MSLKRSLSYIAMLLIILLGAGTILYAIRHLVVFLTRRVDIKVQCTPVYCARVILERQQLATYK